MDDRAVDWSDASTGPSPSASACSTTSTSTGAARWPPPGSSARSATTGVDVRSLRARLGLDSGYLSRLLRSLEQEGLVTVAPDEADGRVRLGRPHRRRARRSSS